jgi:hypothetical protein
MHDAHASSIVALITRTKKNIIFRNKKNYYKIILTNHKEFYLSPYIVLYKHIEMHFHQYVYNSNLN